MITNGRHSIVVASILLVNVTNISFAEVGKSPEERMSEIAEDINEAGIGPLELNQIPRGKEYAQLMTTYFCKKEYETFNDPTWGPRYDAVVKANTDACRPYIRSNQMCDERIVAQFKELYDELTEEKRRSRDALGECFQLVRKEFGIFFKDEPNVVE